MRLARALWALVVALALVAPAQLAEGQAGVYPPPAVTVGPTGVYGVYLGTLDAGYTIYTALPDYSRELIYIAGAAPLGAGFIAAVHLNGTVAWSLTLEGEAVLIDVDDLEDSRWLAAVSVLGDIIVVDLDNPGFYAYYYRALRGEPVYLDVYRAADGTLKVVAQDSIGVVYIFEPPTEYWFEIGPDTGEAPGGYVSGVENLLVTPLHEPRKSGSATSEPILVTLIGGLAEGLYSQLYVQVFYPVDGDVEPAVAGTWNYTVTDPETGVEYMLEEVRLLRLWLVDIYYRSPETLSGNAYPVFVNETSTGEILVDTVFPAPFYVYIEYEVIVRNLSEPNAPIVNYTCYNYFDRVDFPLSGIVAVTATLSKVDANTSIQCELIRNTTYVIEVPDLSLVPIGIVNYADAPEQVPFKITYLPVREEDITAGAVESMYLVKPRQRPSDWVVEGIRYLLVLSTASYAHLYFLNDRLEAVSPAGVPGYSESVFLASPVTSLHASRDGVHLYLGTENGKLYELTWAADGSRRYVKTGSLQVSPSGAAVSSIAGAGGALVLAGTLDGYAQLVDAATWTPLWRGIAVYQALALAEASGVGAAPVGGLWVFGDSSLAGYFQYTPYLVLPAGQGYVGPLYPVYITVNVTVAAVDGGSYALPVEPGSTVVVTASGGPLLVVPLQPIGDGAIATLFLPPGSASFTATIAAGGSNWTVSWDAVIADTVNYVNVTVGLREVVVTVETPPEAGPGYYLVAGPKEGALVTLAPVSVDEGLPYTPNATTLTGTTDPDGAAVFLVYEGVEYNVTASLAGYRVDGAAIEPYGAAAIGLTAHPTLYSLVIQAIDAEVYDYAGETFLVPNVTVTLTLLETGRSIKLAAPSGTLSVEVPPGNYTILLTSTHYQDFTSAVEVTGDSQLTAAMQPKRYTVIVEAFIDDYTGIVSGPAALVRVEAAPMNLPLPPVTAYTDAAGRAVLSLRWALYNISFTHQMLFPYELHTTIEEPETVRVLLEPRYSAIDLSVVDAELAAYGVLTEGATVTLIYTGPFTGGSTTVTLDEGRGLVVVPFGYYDVVAVAPGYHESPVLPLAATRAIVEYSIPLQPIRYPSTILVYFNDEAWNLAAGPVPGALVTVRLVDPPYPVAPSTLVTGPDGSATFNLRSGVYEVTVLHPLLSEYRTLIRVAGQAVYTLRVPPYYVNVTVRVVDAETLAPVPGALVTLTYLSGSSPRHVTVQLEDGTLQTLLPAGRYLIEAIEAHYYAASLDATLEAVGHAELTVVLQPIYQAVEFAVSSAPLDLEWGWLPSIPLAGAVVTLTPTDPVLEAVGAPVVRVETGPDGLAVALVRVGSYAYTVEAAFYRPAEGALKVAEGARVRVQVAMEPVLFRVSVSAVDPELLEPYSTMLYGTVTIESWNGYDVSLEAALDNGTATLTLPAGYYEGVIVVNGYLPAVFNVTLPVEPDVLVALEPVRYTVTVSVTLSSRFGSMPAAGVLVELSSDLPLVEPVVNATLGPDGSATLQLRPANYTLTVYSAGYPEGYVYGPLRVAGNTVFAVEVPAPLFNLTLRAVDSEFPTFPIAANATITYLGPYGSGSLDVPLPNGSATIELPAGEYQVLVTAPYYGAGRAIFNLTNDSVVDIEMPPINVRVEVLVQDVDGNPVPGAVVEFRHAAIPYVKRVVAIYTEGSSVARVPEGIRQGPYTITVTPPSDFYYLKPHEINVVIAGPARFVVTLEPKSYNVTITLVDKETGETITFPYLMRLERRGAGSEVLLIPAEANITGPTTITLPYGTYVATLQALEKDYYVLPPQVSFIVDGPKNVTITLEPKLFPLSIIVNDDRGNPLQGALVQIYDDAGNLKAAGRTDAEGYFTATLRYGTYIIKVTMEGYREASRAASVPDVPSITVNLQPGPIVLLKRFMPLIIGAAGLGAAVYLVVKLRERIAERLAEEEYF